MNRSLSGEVFSREELMEMAVECGAMKRSEITVDMKTWVFRNATRAHRLAMFARGEAILNTRDVFEAKPFVCKVDTELLAFLGVTV